LLLTSLKDDAKLAVLNSEKPIPLYRQIEYAIRERILQGDWVAGQALPNRSLLCIEFGTTRVTLDKAIHELVRIGLLHSAKGSGTYVAKPTKTKAEASPALRLPGVFRIGVVMRETDPTIPPSDTWNDDLYFGPLFQGIRDAVIGASVEIVYAHMDCRGYRSFYQDRALDGMILVAPARSSLPTMQQMKAEHIPFVAVGFSLHTAEDAALPCLDTDNIAGAAEAARHLLKLGHRRIAIVNLATAHANHADRQESCQRILAAAGAPVQPENLVLYPKHVFAQFEEHIEEWLWQVQAKTALPTAIFACDYMMALATLRVLRRHSLRVPEDISLVSFDDPLSAAHLTPPLTTVRQPVFHLGRRAILRLLHALQENTETVPLGVEILPTELILRESTGAPRLNHCFENPYLLSEERLVS
jgi:DNA-binding LacI/PurR family transcriptional regulator/DNA-binding transcriptional regulator YhcF (GntR family)